MSKKQNIDPAVAAESFCSPVGELSIAANAQGIVRIEFIGFGQDSAAPLVRLSQNQTDREAYRQAESYIRQARDWLRGYFLHQDPGDLPPLCLQGTDFQKEIWALIQEIPYGQTISYNQLAKKAAARRKAEHISCQAVGTAVGKNPIPILVPCHRVIRSDGHVGNYTPDPQIKLLLLAIEQEGADPKRLYEGFTEFGDPFGQSA